MLEVLETQQQPLELSLFAPMLPSPIDNNDFSQGLDGWDTSLSHPGSVTLIPHEE